jgi:transposase
MIQLTPQMRILVAVEAVDFRSGIDGLARICKQQLQTDPFSGAVYVFRNRRSTSIKALVYNGQGFCHGSQHDRAAEVRLGTPVSSS